MELIWPSIDALESYSAALRQGWSPDTMRPETSVEQLEAIARDPVAFVASLVDRDAAGEPIPLPDGTFGQRIPGFHKWMWDGEFAGSIGFRWQPGTHRSAATLPRPHRLQRRAVEASARLRDRGVAADPSRRRRRRTRVRRAHDRPREHRLAARDRSQRRRPARRLRTGPGVRHRVQTSATASPADVSGVGTR